MISDISHTTFDLLLVKAIYNGSNTSKLQYKNPLIGADQYREISPTHGRKGRVVHWTTQELLSSSQYLHWNIREISEISVNTSTSNIPQKCLSHCIRRPAV